MRYQPQVSGLVRCSIRAMIVFLGLFWISHTLAVGSDQDTSVVESPQILWKVRSPKNTIYLAGSIHVLQRQHYPLGQAFDDAFNQSSRVIFEVNLDKISSPTAQMTMMQKGLYLNGQTLQTVLSPNNYFTARDKITELGLRIEDFHRMKPWMAATAVMALELQKLGFENAYGVDRHYFRKAQAAGKHIQGLETVEFQLNLFNQLPLAIQVQFLMQTLEELKDLEGEIQKMVTAWQQGNVQDLGALLDSMREYPELFREIVVNRNHSWLPHIEHALQENEPVFIVVGALHLLGKEGLITALREKGYVIQQL